MRRLEKRARTFAKELRQNMPEAEVMLWSRLRQKDALGVRFRRQHPIGPYIADFACISAKLVIELDGATHAMDEQHAHDLRRDAYMVQRGWRVVRLKNEDIYRDMASVVAAIFTRVAPPPSAARDRAASTSPALAGEEDQDEVYWKSVGGLLLPGALPKPRLSNRS